MKTSKMWMVAALALNALQARASDKQELSKLIAQSARVSKDCRAGHRQLDLEGTEVFPLDSVYKDEAQVKHILDKVEAFGREQPKSLWNLRSKLMANAALLKPEQLNEGITEMQRCPRLAHFSVMSNLVKSTSKLNLKPETRERVGRAALDFIAGKSFPAFLPVETLWQVVLLDMMMDADLLALDAPQKEKIKTLVREAKLAQAHASRRAEESKSPDDKKPGELFAKQSQDMREVRERLSALEPKLKLK